MNWYVLFVKTGYEQKVLKEISNAWGLEGLNSFVPMYDTRFRKDGKVFKEKRRLFPGYIFLESEKVGKEFYAMINPLIVRSENALKLLRYGVDYEDSSSFEMKNEERQLFLKLYDKNYCIEMSKGYIIGDKVRVTEGSLEGLESLIKKINRHKLEAVLQIEFMGRLTEVTVGLHVLEKLPLV